MGRRRAFDETYPTREGYTRFDQRNTSFGLRQRRRGAAIGYATEEERLKQMRRNLPGYSIVDYAFKDAAGMYEGVPGEEGTLDFGFYKWTSLGATAKPRDLPRWEGSPDEAARIVGKAARYFGAVGAGFCAIDERWIYSHDSSGRPIVFEDVEEGYTTGEKAVIPTSHRWVVALTVPMEFRENSNAPTALDVTSNMGYSRMHILAGFVAEFIRGLGYHAVPMGNDTSLSVPIAVQAGLGHVGRNGRLITWERGPLVRICKIFTDLPLPTSPQAPTGIIEFCEACEKCSKMCPSGSIPRGPRTWEPRCEANNPGALKWYCDEEACLEYWHEVKTGCSICFRVCSFTKEPGLRHDAVKWFIRNVPQLNGLWVWSDELLGYGRIGDLKGYWDEE
ncbi:MAG: reductive dehalogenase [Candidatus Bathyarchaeota archaeon]|nr:reductive dehalogenase [Candidatus Bathyarchaeota archaeon]